MNIYEYLKYDHDKVAKLFKQAFNQTAQKERVKLFSKIKYELELHADPEKNTFYEAIKSKKKSAEETVNEGNSEHETIKALLKKITKAKNKDQWLIHFGELKSIVEHHVHEEEGKIFEEAKKILTPAQEENLVIEMEKLKENKKKAKTFIEQFKELLGLTKPKKTKGRTAVKKKLPKKSK